MRQGYACPKCNSYNVRRYKYKIGMVGKWKCYSCGVVFALPIQRFYTKDPTKKRNPDKMEKIDYEHLLYMIQNNMMSLREQAFMSILYLTGARISEIVKQLRAGQLSVKWIDNRAFLMFENVLTLKRRKAYYRNIPVNYENYKDMCDLIAMYVEDFNKDDILFDFNRGRGYTIIRNRTNLFPHYFRTLRNTHLEAKGLSPYDLQKIMGWTSTRPADNYIKKDVNDVAKRM